MGFGAAYGGARRSMGNPFLDLQTGYAGGLASSAKRERELQAGYDRNRKYAAESSEAMRNTKGLITQHLEKEYGEMPEGGWSNEQQIGAVIKVAPHLAGQIEHLYNSDAFYDVRQTMSNTLKGDIGFSIGPNGKFVRTQKAGENGREGDDPDRVGVHTEYGTQAKTDPMKQYTPFEVLDQAITHSASVGGLTDTLSEYDTYRKTGALGAQAGLGAPQRSNRPAEAAQQGLTDTGVPRNTAPRPDQEGMDQNYVNTAASMGFDETDPQPGEGRGDRELAPGVTSPGDDSPATWGDIASRPSTEDAPRLPSGRIDQAAITAQNKANVKSKWDSFIGKRQKEQDIGRAAARDKAAKKQAAKEAPSKYAEEQLGAVPEDTGERAAYQKKRQQLIEDFKSGKASPTIAQHDQAAKAAEKAGDTKAVEQIEADKSAMVETVSRTVPETAPDEISSNTADVVEESIRTGARDTDYYTTTPGGRAALLMASRRYGTLGITDPTAMADFINRGALPDAQALSILKSNIKAQGATLKDAKKDYDKHVKFGRAAGEHVLSASGKEKKDNSKLYGRLDVMWDNYGEEMLTNISQTGAFKKGDTRKSASAAGQLIAAFANSRVENDLSETREADLLAFLAGGADGKGRFGQGYDYGWLTQFFTGDNAHFNRIMANSGMTAQTKEAIEIWAEKELANR